ncbi:MAG: shikimate kinase [Fidelibacterota bacterium]
MIIFLTGMMGTGKTKIGQALAETIKCPFVDLDFYLEKKTGKSIPDIFRTEGEAAFRKLEREIKFDPILKTPDLVIATGGGFPLDEGNREWMQSTGVVIWLQAESQTILNRIQKSDNRPMLPRPLRLAHIENILEKRTFVYKQANYYIQTDGKSIRDIVREILEKVEKNHA